MNSSIEWQKEHFSKPYEVFDIKAVAAKQAELGRVLTKEEFEPYVFGFRVFGENKGFKPKEL